MRTAPRVPLPIAMRTFRDYGAVFGWFAFCLTCVRDEVFTSEDTEQFFGFDADAARRLRWGTESGYAVLHHRIVDRFSAWTCATLLRALRARCRTSVRPSRAPDACSRRTPRPARGRCASRRC